MPQISNGKRVLHKFIGSTQTFSDDTIWEELELPTGSIGYVFAQVDLVNKTAKLAGLVKLPTVAANSSTIVIPAQNNWRFAIPDSKIIVMRNSDDANSATMDKLSTDTNGNLIFSNASYSTFTNPSFVINSSSINPTENSSTSFYQNPTPVTFPITIK